MNNLLKIMKKRRSIYALNNKSTLNEETLIESLQDAMKCVPSAFNSQSSKIVLLLNEQHLKLWDIALETLRKVVPSGQIASTEAKIAGFAAAHGTILFFEDTSITKQFQQDFSFYKDNFPVWAQQSNGMLQYAVWTLLSDLGLGANLQHYNPIIDDEVKQVFGINSKFQLVAQMPFGKIVEEADEKEFNDIETRFQVIK